MPARYYKIILLGGSSIGKTSLLTRYIDNSFSASFQNTVGMGLRVKMVERNGVMIQVQIVNRW